MLERNTVIYNRRKEHLNYYAMQNLLPEMKDYLPWLKEADSKALQYACRQLNAAFDRFFINRVVIQDFTASVENNHIRLRMQALYVLNRIE